MSNKICSVADALCLKKTTLHLKVATKLGPIKKRKTKEKDK